MGSAGGEELIGRSAELRALEEEVEALAGGRGGATVIAGPPGIGKSTLLRAITERARDRLRAEHAVVVSVAAVDAEREWPNSGLNLVLSGMIGSLAPADRRAVESAVGDLLAAPNDDMSSYNAAMRMQSLVDLAPGPMLIVVDDAHLLDRRSQEILGFVARRMRSLPVGLILAADESAGARALVDGLPILRLPELDRNDAVNVVLTVHDDTARSVAAELAERVGGNPQVLLEIAARLSSEQRAGRVALDRFLPSSPVLQGVLLPELKELTGDQRFALLTAAASSDGKLAPLMVALADSDHAVHEWLIGNHLEVSDGHFRLRRPAVGSVIWRDASLGEQARAHSRLAHAYNGLDDDLVLWHRALAEIEHDEALATELQRVSGESLVRGEYERSVALARESVRLTSDPERRVERLLWSGELALFAGRGHEAVHIAGERVRMDTSAEQGAELALLEARARLLGDGRVPVDLVTGYSESFKHADPDRAARFRLVAASGFADRLELAAAEKHLRLVEEQLPKLSMSTLGSYRRIAAWLASLSGELGRAAELIEADSRAADVFADAERCIQHARVLTRLERYGEARELLRTVTRYRRFGDSPVVLGDAYAVTVVVEMQAGRLSAAADAAQAWQTAAATSANSGNVPIYMTRAYAWMGDAEAAQRSYAAAQERTRLDDRWTSALLHSASGAMFLELGHLTEAKAALERARDGALAYADPSLLPAEPEFIEACVRAGDRERAESALAAYAVRVARVPTAWSQHTLVRCQALVASDEDSLTLFAAAVRMRAEEVSPVELARTQLCYGGRLRRMGRRAEAADWLRRAMVLATECGAFGLVRRAEEELGPGSHTDREAAGSGRAQGGENLTEAEVRIAHMVAHGKRNREIATELYVSVRTVETHLGRIYRKLGVRSRAELARVVMLDGSSASGARPE